MRKTLAMIGTSVMLSTALTGCINNESVDNNISSTSEAAGVSDNEETEPSGEAETSETETEIETESESENAIELETEPEGWLSVENILEQLNVNLLAHSVLNIEQGNIEGDIADYPLTNNEEKATLLTVTVTDDTDLELLSQASVDATLVNAAGEVYSENAAKDTSWCFTDTNGHKANLYIFRVPGEFDADDFQIRLSADNVELTRSLDTTHMGNFSQIDHTVVIEGRTYRYLYATIGSGTSENEETGKETIGFTEQLLLTPLEGSLNVSIDNECIRFVFDIEEGVTYGEAYNCYFEAKANGDQLSFTAYAEYDKDIEEGEKIAIETGLKDYLKEYLVGFGLASGTGEESVIPSKYLSNI